jgi:TolB-like protein/cytochrome c-type biogenesis protein CcmH/NrfG
VQKSRFATTRSFLREQWFWQNVGGSSVQFLFADHMLDTDRRELHRGSEAISVEPQVLDLLICLVQNRNRVVTKDDLIASVWRGRIVSEATLTSRVYAARKAVGDSGQGQRLIRTIARKGLRFVGDVRTGCDQSVAAADEIREPVHAALPLPERPAIAVLPFDNMCGDPAQEYFSDGISEDIITALSKLRWFFVIARNSSFTYKGKAVHIRQVAEELGVSYVLEGSVRKLGERVRITAQLNDVTTGGHIWAERYDRDLADVFAVQDEITEAIVAAIEPQIYAAENFRARRKPPERLDAWDLVMRALSHYWRVTRQDNVAAQELLERAIAIDPNYGQALGLLATSHIFGVHMGWSDKTVAPLAERAALAAIRADSEDPWAHHALGCTYLFGRRFDDALAEFESALRLNPNFSLAQCYYCVTLAYSGRWQEAEQAVHRALRLSPRDPLSALYYGAASYAQFVGRNYDKAMELARTSIRLRGDFTGAHRVLVAASGMAGQAEVAASALQELRRAQPDISLAWIAERMPIRLDADREHYLEGFRRAGLD